jgi:hypothetical protein
MLDDDDDGWMKPSPKHPSGWYYHWHSGKRVGADVLSGSIELPRTLRLREREEYFVLTDGTAVLVSHEQQTARRIYLNRDYDNESPILGGKENWSAQQEYWAHVAKHPSHLTDTQTARILKVDLMEALCYLRWCCTETLLPSLMPTAAFSFTLSMKLIQVIDTMSPGISSQHEDVILVAQILTKKYESYANHKFGTSNCVSFVETPNPQPKDLRHQIKRYLTDLFYVPSSIIFLGAPPRYRKLLLDMHTAFIRGDEWHDHIHKMLDGWSDSNLLATVMLPAGVSYLAVLDLSQVSTTAVLISILSALGSITSGLYCIGVYRSYDPVIETPRSAADMDHYRFNITAHGPYRIHAFAVILGLPDVFLMWSVIAFTVATIAYNFDGAKLSVGAYTGVSVIFYAIALAVGAMVLSLWYAWGREGTIFSKLARSWRETLV